MFAAEKTRVIHAKDWDQRNEEHVYIGRAGRGQDSYFGCPIDLHKPCPECFAVHRSLRRLLACYDRYVARRLYDWEFRDRVRSLYGQTLVCFCSPGPCHGDVLARWAARLRRRQGYASISVGFTGHRSLDGTYDDACPAALWTKQALREALYRLREEHRHVKAYIGMAAGADTWAAQACAELEVPFTAVLPFLGHDTAWPPAARSRLRELLGLARRRIVARVGVDARRPDAVMAAVRVRNQMLVDRCDILVAVWDGRQHGGTWDCVQRAREKGVPIALADPAARRLVFPDLGGPG